MTAVLTWVRYLHSRGMTLSKSDGRLVVIPENRLTPGDWSVLGTHEEALLDVWEMWEERAAIMEFDGRLLRQDAERLAWERVLAPLPVQAGATSAPLAPVQSASLPVSAGERGGQAAPGRARLARSTRA